MAILKKKELKRDELSESKKSPVAVDSHAGERKQHGSDQPAAAKSSQPDATENPERSQPDSAAPDAAGSWSARLGSRKILFLAIPALCLVVIASGALFFKFDAVKRILGRGSPHSLDPVTSISRPVPIPEYREMLDFLVLNEVENQKTITSFRIEVLFNSPSRYQNYKEQNVIFRDTVYAFLQGQNTSRNTPRVWQAVVEKELLEYIKVKLPLSRADIIKLTQVENL